jgi:hypothetical protein
MNFPSPLNLFLNTLIKVIYTHILTMENSNSKVQPNPQIILFLQRAFDIAFQIYLCEKFHLIGLLFWFFVYFFDRILGSLGWP